MTNKLKEAIELVDKLLNFTVYDDLIDHHDTVCKELPKLLLILQEANDGKEVVDCKKRFPSYNKSYYDGICTECKGVVFSDNDAKFCVNCKTKLIWPNTDEQVEGN